MPETNLLARMRRSDEGLVLVEDSYIRGIQIESASKSLKSLRARLLDDGALVERDGHYRLTKDTLLRSASSAAILVNGRSTNGWDAWVAKDGRTLSYVYREGGELVRGST